MVETIVREITNPDSTLKVLIVQRKDGTFTYRRQEMISGDWSKPTIDAGVYDSPDTAESEARQRVAWLRELFH